MKCFHLQKIVKELIDVRKTKQNTGNIEVSQQMDQLHFQLDKKDEDMHHPPKGEEGYENYKEMLFCLFKNSWFLQNDPEAIQMYI